MLQLLVAFHEINLNCDWKSAELFIKSILRHIINTA